MQFSDIALSRRLEVAEGQACVQFAEARRRMVAGNNSEWMECAGAYAIFDGVGSPTTQTFGLGLFEELTAASLDKIERFFLDRGAAVLHEISPLAGPAALQLLASRGYKPVEISSVMVRPTEKPTGEFHTGVSARLVAPEEAEVWASISAKAWSHDHPELFNYVRETAAVAGARDDSPSFIAELDGEPGAAGSLCIHNGVALFAGAATVPHMRRRGLQSALLQERMRYAVHHGCDLAMMVAEAGGKSQRNAERQGFHIAYTRLKWQLFVDDKV